MTHQPPSAVPKIRTFESDNRDNPGLHNLHVGWAYGNLKLVKEFLDEAGQRSQISMSMMTVALWEAMRAEITRDAAYFEAAALLFAGLPPPEEKR